MSVPAIREKIIADIEVSDEDLLRKISTLIEDYRAQETFQWNTQQRAMMMEKREKYFRGEGRSYSFEEAEATICTRVVAMNYVLDIRPLAILEAAEAFDWYESQRAGLGYIFLTELRALLRKAPQKPRGDSRTSRHQCDKADCAASLMRSPMRLLRIA